MEQQMENQVQYKENHSIQSTQRKLEDCSVDNDKNNHKTEISSTHLHESKNNQAAHLNQHQTGMQKRSRRRNKFKSQFLKVIPLELVEVTPSKRQLTGHYSEEQHQESNHQIANFYRDQQLESKMQDGNKLYSTKQSRTLQFIDYEQESSSQQEQEQQQKEIKEKSMLQGKTVQSNNPETGLNRIDFDIARYYRKNSQQKLSTFKASSLEQLAFSSVPMTFTVKCLIKFQKTIFSGDTYDLYLEDDKKHFLRASKGAMPMSSLFQISDPKKHLKIAEIHKNFTGTEYIVLGKNLQSNRRTKTEINQDDYNDEMSWITFSPNIFGFSGQKNINLVKRLKKVPKSNRFSDLKYCWEEGDRQRVKMLSHRMAEKHNGAYELDFRGVVKVPSSKNTIIEDDKGKECILFGKRTPNIFVLHVSNPLSLIEAFSLGVAILDRKLLVH